MSTSNNTVIPFALEQMNEAVMISISAVLDDFFSVFTRFEMGVAAANELNKKQQARVDANSRSYAAMVKQYNIKKAVTLAVKDGTCDEQAATTSLIWSMIGTYRWARDNDNEVVMEYVLNILSHIASYINSYHGKALQHAAAKAYRNMEEASEYNFETFNVPTLYDVETIFSSDRDELEEAAFKASQDELIRAAMIAGVKKEHLAGYIKGITNADGSPKVPADATMEDCLEEVDSTPFYKEKLAIFEKYAVVVKGLGHKIGGMRNKYRSELQAEEADSIAIAWGRIVPDLMKDERSTPASDLESELGYWFLVKLDSYLDKKGLLWDTAMEDFTNATNNSLLNPRPGAVTNKGIPRTTKVSADHVMYYQKRLLGVVGLRRRINATISAWADLKEIGPDEYLVASEAFGKICATRVGEKDSAASMMEE